MEIEAKFAVPDEATYRRLQEARALAGFTLQPGPTKENRDRYLDTRDRRFLVAGYFCRLRSEGDGYLITLKGLGDANGAIHRRDEREVKLPEPELDPARWPDSPATWLAQEIAGRQPLQPLFEIHQMRAKRLVFDGEREVAELTADTVQPLAGTAGATSPTPYYELEIELHEAGVEADLERLAAELQTSWGLRPEPRSKFERASAVLGLDRPPQPTIGDALAPYEQSALEEYARGPRIWARRAAAVLGWAAGQPTREVAGAAGLSTGRVRFWVRAWRGSRMAIFARHRGSKPVTSGGVATQEETAAMAKQANQDGAQGAQTEEQMPAATAEPAGPDTQERHTEPIPAPSALGADVVVPSDAAPEPSAPQAATQTNAADGPQASDEPAGSTEARPAPGPSAEAQAPDQAGSGAPPETLPAEPEPAPAEEVDPLAWLKQPVAPGDPMPEAGRKIMYIHFRRMAENEEGTRSGEDTENLHDMRVSTRRLRAAYLLFEPYFEAKEFGQFNKQLRQTGRTLGAVRDLDVLIEKAERYQTEHELPAPGLEPLAHAWHEQRDADRAKLIDYLDSKKYRKFTEDFEKFLTTPGAGALPVPHGEPVAFEVRHVVPRLIMGRYEDVRAYERLLPDSPLGTYHQLRITCKKLRYAMEFFRDVMGNGAGGLIKQVVAMQDLLGNLQDASVAEGLIAEFLADQARGHAQAAHQEPLEGVALYLSAQWTTQRDLLAAFPPLWSGLTGYDFRRSLSLALAEM